MKKAAGLLCCGALALLMTGCNFSETLSNIVLRNDPEHKEYLSLSESNKENEDGQYAEPETEEVTQDHTGKVHVTFAESNWLEIRYYDDEGKKNEIDTENCYLDPGTLIYTEGKPKVADSGTDSYSLAGFRLALFSEGGEDSKDGEDGENSDDTDISRQISGDFRNFSADEPIKIPADLKENEGIGIIPISEHGTIVKLSQPERGGTITYFVNGEEILDDTVIVKPSDELTADFKNDNRNHYEKNNVNDGNKWKVSKNEKGEQVIEYQTVSGSYIGVDKVFTIDEDRQPKLTVKLDKSCGTNPLFDVYYETDPNKSDKDGISEIKSGRFDDTLMDLDTNLIEEKPINTTVNICISVTNWSTSDNEAMRITAEKKYNNQNKTEILYFTSKKDSCVINIKDDPNVADITNIDIKIEKVEGSFFKRENYKLDNANVDFFYSEANNGTKIQDGDFVDNDQEIRMRVTPDADYKLDVDFKERRKLDSYGNYEDRFRYKDISDKFNNMKKHTEVRK